MAESGRGEPPAAAGKLPARAKGGKLASPRRVRDTASCKQSAMARVVRPMSGTGVPDLLG
jgi:hypothetical protein